MKENKEHTNYACMVPSTLLSNQCYYCFYKEKCNFWDKPDLDKRWQKAALEMEADMASLKINENVPWENRN